MNIEVCLSRLEDISKVQSLAIDRIELCIEIGCGGLTPPLALVEKALAISDIPIHVLVRHRSGDFHYSTAEIELMQKSCEHMNRVGVAGIVIGALTSQNTLPIEALRAFRETVKKGQLYFHRAFDEVKNPTLALKQLMELQYDGILSSGQKDNALEGIKHLNDWKSFVNRKLVILPGGGINADNCLAFKENEFEWIHLSAKKQFNTKKKSNFDAPQYGLDIDLLKKVIDSVKS